MSRQGRHRNQSADAPDVTCVLATDCLRCLKPSWTGPQRDAAIGMVDVNTSVFGKHEHARHMCHTHYMDVTRVQTVRHHNPDWDTLAPASVSCSLQCQ